MKLTKGEFRKIIKECMQELINEGAFDLVLKEILNNNYEKFFSAEEKNKKNNFTVEQQKLKETTNKHVGADKEENFGNTENIPINPRLQSLVENVATSLAKGNSALANQYVAIFADTAINTLPKQLANDPTKGNFSSINGINEHSYLNKVHEQDLQKLAPMGDIKKWAELAFDQSIKNKI